MNGANRLTGKEIIAAMFKTLHGFLLFFGALFAGIPLIIAIAFGTVAWREHKVLNEGRHATATIVAKNIDSDSDSTSYYLVYEFVAADGKKYGGRKGVASRYYYSVEQGGSLEIRYDPADPFSVAVPGMSTTPIWVLGFLSIFLVVGGVIFTIGFRGVRKKLALYGSGMQAWGTPRGIREDPSVRVNNRPCQYLEFEFTDYQGQMHVCKSCFVNDSMIAKLEQMQTVPVVYLPERPDEADLDLDRMP